MQPANTENQFVVCINNRDYQGSLEIRKIYQVISHYNAFQHQMIRVVNESGEDYLYSSNYFIPIELPKAVEEAFSPFIVLNGASLNNDQKWYYLFV